MDVRVFYRGWTMVARLTNGVGGVGRTIGPPLKGMPTDDANTSTASRHILDGRAPKGRSGLGMG